MKAKIVVGALAVVVIAVGIYLYKHAQPHVPETMVYRDTDTGFNLVIPAAWNQIGYSIDIGTDPKSGAKIYNFILNYKDSKGVAQKFTPASTIAAVPISATSSYCQPSPIDCAPTQEIGRNTSYFFLSVTNSPQAWADCTPGTSSFDQGFYDRNKTLCTLGKEALAYPERNPNSFTVFRP